MKQRLVRAAPKIRKSMNTLFLISFLTAFFALSQIHVFARSSVIEEPFLSLETISKEAREAVSVRTLLYKGKYTRIWIYKDLMKKFSETSDKTMKAVFQSVEKKVIPALLETFSVTAEDAGIDKKHPVDIVLDDVYEKSKHLYRGYYSPSKLGDHTILIDLNLAESASVTNLKDPVLSTVYSLSHELTHVLFFQKKPDEEAWVNEGLADLMSFLLGRSLFGYDVYKVHSIDAYLRNPSRSLTSFDSWDPSGADYGKSFLYFIYLYDHFGGNDFLKALYQGSDTGLKGLQYALNTADGAQWIPAAIRSNASVYTHFSYALEVNDERLNRYRLFGFQSVLVPNQYQGDFDRAEVHDNPCGNLKPFQSAYVPIGPLISDQDALKTFTLSLEGTQQPLVAYRVKKNANGVISRIPLSALNGKPLSFKKDDFVLILNLGSEPSDYDLELTDTE